MITGWTGLKEDNTDTGREDKQGISV